jgi:hypothetical protein
MTGLYFTKEFAGHQRRLLSECFRTGAGISCFIGNLSIVVGYIMDYGFIIATDYLFVNST